MWRREIDERTGDVIWIRGKQKKTEKETENDDKKKKKKKKKRNKWIKWMGNEKRDEK